MSEPRPIVFDKDPPAEPTDERLLSLFRHENSWLRSRVAELENDLKSGGSVKEDDGWKAALAEIARLEGEIGRLEGEIGRLEGELTARDEAEAARGAARVAPPSTDQAVKDIRRVVHQFQRSPVRVVLRRRSGWRDIEDRWGRSGGKGQQ